MRIARGVLGGLLIMIGAVWFLQGINVLPGSFMTDKRSGPCTAGLRQRRALGCFGLRNAERADDNRLGGAAACDSGCGLKGVWRFGMGIAGFLTFR